MRGVILGGGQGTRLLPFTKVINKHLLPVGDNPMIYYPIKTLKDMGVTQIILVTGGENIGSMAELLGDGHIYGVDITYRVQERPGGIAQALGCVEGLVDGVFPVILGDNYFSVAPYPTPKKPSLITKKVEQPERFGVYDPKRRWITEKPKQPRSKQAVTGLYFYDQKVFKFIKTLKPSKRGELEITDVNNWYLKNYNVAVYTYEDDWSDMGTFESLHRTAMLARRR